MSKWKPTWCNSADHIWRPNRREFLYVGVVGTLGLTLGNLLRLEALAAPSAGAAAASGPAAKSVINIYLPGGMAAQETLDPKLLAPIEYRGPLGTVKTKLPGIHFSEVMSKTAQVADKICVVRSMTHGEADHDRGTHNMYTGYRPSPAIHYPSFAVSSRTNSGRAMIFRPTSAFPICRRHLPARVTLVLRLGLSRWAVIRRIPASKCAI